MYIIPAIDIKDGKCTQLVGGKLGTEKYYGDPVKVGSEWKRKGAKILHIIDLDAAFGRNENINLVKQIKDSTRLPIHFGGGIRDYERAHYLLSEGFDRIILGTMAVNDHLKGFENIKKLVSEFGNDRIICAVDSKDGVIVVDGWQKKTAIKTQDFMKEIEKYIWGFLFTNVNVEGRMEGIDEEAIKQTLSATDKPVIISGGVSSEEDIRTIAYSGAWGVVLGKALYEGKISFKGEKIL